MMPGNTVSRTGIGCGRRRSPGPRISCGASRRNREEHSGFDRAPSGQARPARGEVQGGEKGQSFRMSMYEVGRDLLGEIASIRRPRQISRLFRFIRTKNRIVRRQTTVVCEAPRVSPCLISLARDGGHLTKAFLTHYRDLGFRSFVFLDNGSMDRCASRLIDVAKMLGCDLTV